VAKTAVVSDSGSARLLEDRAHPRTQRPGPHGDGGRRAVFQTAGINANNHRPALLNALRIMRMAVLLDPKCDDVPVTVDHKRVDQRRALL